ncbi:hypothetical protein ACSAZK_08850 [Methanosarcina sp. Mfa9]|uniref:hypothetical protein n=1 Tax=Methanosarcina sp. Mfa9 TaxID=3439063 RepID=UPI003F82736D
MVFSFFRQLKPVSLIPASLIPISLIFALLTVLMFQCTVLQCAASDSGSQQAVWVDRTAYSPGETVLVSVNETFFNGSNITAYVIFPTLAVTDLTLIPSETGYTAEYSPQHGVVLGTYTVFVSGENVTETVEFDIRTLSVYPDLEESYPPGNISISGDVTDTASGNPVNASVEIIIDGITLSTSATEGFFSTDYQAVSTGQKNLSITANDDENITGKAAASFEVYALSGDTTKPVINSVSDTPDPVESGGNVTITADVTDNVEVGTVLVEINGTEYPMALPELWMNRTQLFFDGFESGNLTTNNWTASGTGDPWQVEEASGSYEGSFNALTSGAGEKTLEAGIDTAGYENLELSLYYRVSGLSGSGYFAIDWYDGEQWNSIFNFTDHTVQYTYFNSSLPDEACDNPDFKLRFRCSLGPGDTARIDNLELTGTGVPSEPYGYIYDSSGLVPGVYSYTVHASDSSENEAVPLTGSFTVVDGIPGISSVSASPNPVEQGENITISVDVVDGFEVNGVLVNIEGINYTVAEGVNTESKLFFDGFESGSLGTNNWTCSGSGNPWFIHYKPNKAHAGDYSLLVTNTDKDGGGASSVETDIDTAGYSEINLSFYYSCDLSADKLEYFSVDWYDGEEWNCLLNTSVIENADLFFNSVLPPAAGDNPDFKLRFNCNSTNSADSVRVDNVEVKGKRIVPRPFEYLYNTSALSPGVYDYTVYANDTLGREAVPVEGNFTVQEPSSGGGSTPGDGEPGGGEGFETSDALSPIINLISASPDPAERGENISFIANVTDNVSVGTVLVELEGINYTMSGLRAEAQLFSDDFESGSLETQNWTCSGSGNPWTIGTDGLTNEAVAMNTGGVSTIEKSIDTAGYENVTFSFEARTEGLDPGKYLAVDWYNGTQWTNLLQTVVTESTGFNYELPAGAGNNSDFKIRFLCDIGEGEYCYVDNVEVNGTGNVPDMYEYSFDSSGLLPGTRAYTIYANDSSGNAAAPLTGNFTVINSPPFLSPIGPGKVNESELLTIKLSATDPNGDPIIYGSNASFGTLVGDTFTWMPGFTDSGVYHVEFTASDGEMNDSETVTITVNESYVNFSVSKRIEKGATPDSYSVVLNLTSHVDFNGSGLMVYDLLPGNFTLADPVPACSGSQGNIYCWNLDLAAGESRTVTYTLEGTGRYSLEDAFVVGVDPQ